VDSFCGMILYLRCTYRIGVIVLQYNTVRIFNQNLYCRTYFRVRILQYLQCIHYWLHCEKAIVVYVIVQQEQCGQ
jgi:hypothetical protein